MFAFMQQVSTPRGPGYFIAPLTDGVHCQVAIREGRIQRNPIFRLDQIAEHKKVNSSKATQEPVLQVADSQ